MAYLGVERTDTELSVLSQRRVSDSENSALRIIKKSRD